MNKNKLNEKKSTRGRKPLNFNENTIDDLGNNYQTISFKKIRKQNKFIRKRKPTNEKRKLTNKKSLECQKCEENYESIKNVSEKLENIEKMIDEYKTGETSKYKFPDVSHMST
ncbi:16539_t:CDS:1, partial [Cetraspora pellucida]